MTREEFAEAIREALRRSDARCSSRPSGKEGPWS